MTNLKNIEITKIYPHPDNPRKELGDLKELAESIKTNGVLQNLTVVPMEEGTYRVVIGHRRLAASAIAGLETVPCVVTEMSTKEQLATMLLENMQRSDLSYYEQAQGFQMMLDLGESVASIAQSTGFSQTTVRNRMKLLRLNQETFKKSMSRNATLEDYLKLDEIEDDESRDKVLSAIGTANFKDELRKALENQAAQKRLAQWANDLVEFAIEIEQRDYVGEKYVSMDYVRAYNRWSKDPGIPKPEDCDKVQYYYRKDSDGFSLYKEHQEREETPEERARREEAEAYKKRGDELEAISSRHYNLRLDFICEFHATKTNMKGICEFAIFALLCDRPYYANNINTSALAEALCIDVNGNTTREDVMQALILSKEEYPVEYITLATIFATADNGRNAYYEQHWDSEERHWLYRHKENGTLDAIYKYLCALGYEMSDEEKAMQDGTHELFQDDANAV